MYLYTCRIYGRDENIKDMSKSVTYIYIIYVGGLNVL